LTVTVRRLDDERNALAKLLLTVARYPTNRKLLAELSEIPT
jgi:hypothetical protein